MTRREGWALALLVVAGALAGGALAAWLHERPRANPAGRLPREAVLTRVGEGGVTPEALEKELHRRLERRDGGRSRADAATVRETMEALVEKELLFQEALSRGALREPLLRRRVVNEWLEQQAELRFPDAALSGEEIRAYYDAHPDAFTVPAAAEIEQVTAAAPEADPTARREAYRLIRFLRDEVAAAPETLGARVAAATGDAGEAAVGVRFARTGWIEAGFEPAALWEAARSLRAGELSEVLESPVGYHLVRVLQVRDLAREPYARAIGKARAALRRERLEAFRADLERQLRDELGVELEEDALDLPALPSRDGGRPHATSPVTPR